MHPDVPAYFFSGTVKTTSALPVFPAASCTRSTSTYVPGLNTPVRNRKL